MAGPAGHFLRVAGVILLAAGYVLAPNRSGMMPAAFAITFMAASADHRFFANDVKTSGNRNNTPHGSHSKARERKLRGNWVNEWKINARHRPQSGSR